MEINKIIQLRKRANLLTATTIPTGKGKDSSESVGDKNKEV